LCSKSAVRLPRPIAVKTVWLQLVAKWTAQPETSFEAKKNVAHRDVPQVRRSELPYKGCLIIYATKMIMCNSFTPHSVDVGVEFGVDFDVEAGVGVGFDVEPGMLETP
jgi:hypothetical protein